MSTNCFTLRAAARRISGAFWSGLTRAPHGIGSPREEGCRAKAEQATPPRRARAPHSMAVAHSLRPNADLIAWLQFADTTACPVHDPHHLVTRHQRELRVAQSFSII